MLSEVAYKYFEYFIKKDLSAIENIFDEQVILKDWNVYKVGKFDVLKYYNEMFNSIKFIDLKIINLVENDRHVAADLLIKIDNEKLSVLDLIEIRNNKILQIKAFKG